MKWSSLSQETPLNNSPIISTRFTIQFNSILIHSFMLWHFQPDSGLKFILLFSLEHLQLCSAVISEIFAPGVLMRCSDDDDLDEVGWLQ